MVADHRLPRLMVLKTSLVAVACMVNLWKCPSGDPLVRRVVEVPSVLAVAAVAAAAAVVAVAAAVVADAGAVVAAAAAAVGPRSLVELVGTVAVVAAVVVAAADAVVFPCL